MIAFIVATIVFLFSSQRLLRFLQFFQQEQYWATRFLRWMKATKTYERIFTGVTVATILLMLFFAPLSGVWLLTWGAVLSVRILLEGNPARKGKIKLIMTERAKRVYFLAVAINFAVMLTALFAAPSVLLLLLVGAILFSLSPLVLLTANLLLQPVEKSIQEGFIAEAKEKLRQVDPIIIGITGSYGKTSVKTMLGEALNTAVAPTFYPQKGYNSVMGVTREIRERLSFGIKFAVIEMGAYGIGSIRRACSLTPPKVAIVTAVGLVHVESFGSPENIYKAKSELVQALPRDGILVANGDNPGARRMAAEFGPTITALYGLDASIGPLDCTLKDLQVSPDGSKFKVCWKGEEYEASTVQLGTPAVSNFLAAFCCACLLGGDPRSVLTALHSLPPVSNRLEIKKHGEVTYLNDAYNSNPVGFKAALEILKMMPGKKKLLMTPGMIELGEKQFEENKDCAKVAAAFCDLVIVVSTPNREALVAGLKEGGLVEDSIKVVDTREEAFAILASEQMPGDVILIENDLPDLYESEVRL